MEKFISRTIVHSADRFTQRADFNIGADTYYKYVLPVSDYQLLIGRISRARARKNIKELARVLSQSDVNLQTRDRLDDFLNKIIRDQSLLEKYLESMEEEDVNRSLPLFSEGDPDNPELGYFFVTTSHGTGFTPEEIEYRAYLRGMVIDVS